MSDKRQTTDSISLWLWTIFEDTTSMLLRNCLQPTLHDSSLCATQLFTLYGHLRPSLYNSLTFILHNQSSYSLSTTVLRLLSTTIYEPLSPAVHKLYL